MDIESLLEENETSRALYDALRTLMDRIGTANLVISKSQVAFRRKRAFAWVWIPGQYLKRAGLAPLVLTLVFSYADKSPRWKEIVEPAFGKFTHHLELWDLKDVDSQVEAWLRKAWDEAG